jgi:hypothetical protein
MKTYDQLVAVVWTQVLDDIEDERVRQGKKRIVLNSTLPYDKIVEDVVALVLHFLSYLLPTL